MEQINIGPAFVLAGDATYTVSNGEGKHFTFHVYKSAPTSQFPNPSWFISFKRGPEEDDQSYLARVIVNPNLPERDPELKQTPKSTQQPTSPVWKVAAWSLRAIWQCARGAYRLPPSYTIQHDGRCGRCGAKLTNPASLDTGLGPECSAMMGVEWKERVRQQTLEEVASGK